MGKLRKCHGSNAAVSGRKEMTDVACSLQGSEQAHDNRFNQRWQVGITTQPQFDLHVQDFMELLSLSKYGEALDCKYISTRTFMCKCRALLSQETHQC